MPVYGTAQAGGQLTDLQPGDGPFFLWNNETVASSGKSIAFSRGHSNTAEDFGITFLNNSASASVAIQGANVDADANYISITSGTVAAGASFTDTNRFNFYRAICAAGGTGVIVSAMR